MATVEITNVRAGPQALVEIVLVRAFISPGSTAVVQIVRVGAVAGAPVPATVQIAAVNSFASSLPAPIATGMLLAEYGSQGTWQIVPGIIVSLDGTSWVPS